jgi:hypothetical protein
MTLARHPFPGPPPPAPGPAPGDTLSAILGVLSEVRDLLRAPPVPRLALRLDEVADALGVSRRLIERERSAARFPPPDLYIGKCPIWLVSTVENHLTARGGRV